MKIWLSKNSEVSVREQLVTQIFLGIVSRDLKAGEKLPSTRELARRFQIHPNTISAAYRELAERSLVEFKKGSGVYVRENENSALLESELDRIITKFFQDAAARGFTLNEIKARLSKRLAASSPTHFLLVESNSELREILAEEIRAATGKRVESTSLEDFSDNFSPRDAQIAAMFDEAEKLREILPSDESCIVLKANSVPDSMIGETRPSEDSLIAVVSRWETFLDLAKMFLIAARIAPDTLLLRSANEPNWKNGLQSVSLIICDSATAKEFAEDKRVRVFRVIADSSLEELRESVG
jgi:DNA-binding transcriptional regulator YhcF (GntR family)